MEILELRKEQLIMYKSMKVIDQMNTKFFHFDQSKITQKWMICLQRLFSSANP